MKPLKLENLNLFTALRDLVMNAWVIVLAAVIGFLGVKDYHDFMFVPNYTSTMTIIVTEGASANSIASTLNEAIQITEVLSSVFKSELLRAKVSESLGNTKITGVVSTSQIPETNLVKISVTDISPMKAYTTLKAFYDNYNEAFANNILQGVSIRVFSPATVPTSPSNSSSVTSGAIKMGMLAAVACAGLIFLFSFFRDTIKHEHDIEEYVDAPLFGTILHETAGKSRREQRLPTKRKLLLTNPLISYQFVEAFNKMTIKLDYQKKSKGIKSIMVTSIDEHEGKTTVSVNLALALALQGKKVLLIDADLRRPSVGAFFPPEETPGEGEFADFLEGKVSLESIIRKDEESGIVFLRSMRGRPNTAEIIGSTDTMARFLKANREAFDFIVVDTPPMSMVSDTEQIADYVDGTLVVTDQDRIAVADLNDALDVLTKSRSTLLGCILNDLNTMGTLLASFNIHIFDNVIQHATGGYYDKYYSKK